MLILKEINLTATPSSGSWSANTHRICAGLLLQILVEATISTTTFDFSITDEDNITQTWARNRYELKKEVYIPLRGIYTMRIANASTDIEVFKVKLMIQED